MKSSGFSLIETMIVVVVTTLLFSAGLASYAKFNHRQTIKQAADGMAVQLRVIQKKVGSSQNSINCVGANNLISSYRVSYLSTNQYTSTLRCTLTGDTAVTETFTLDEGVEFNAAFASIDFLPLGAGISGNGPTLKLGNCTIPINLGTGGTIVVGDISGC